MVFANKYSKDLIAKFRKFGESNSLNTQLEVVHYKSSSAHIEVQPLNALDDEWRLSW